MIIVQGPSRALPQGIRSVRDLLDRLLVDPSIEHRDCGIDAGSTNRLTFGELTRTSAHIANNLRESTRVGICMNPSLELMSTLAGVVRRGIPYVALDPSLPPERLAYIARDSAVDVIVGQSGLDFAAIDAAPIRSFEEIARTSHAPLEETPPVTEEDVFCILYTSGSSGKPKAVPIPHRAVLNRLHWQWATSPWRPGADVSSVKTSLGFVDSIAELWAPLLKGIPSVIIPKPILLAPERLVDTLGRFGVTHLLLIPSLLRRWVDHMAASGVKAETLRHIVVSGEALPRDLCLDFFRVFDQGTCALSNYYGTTEVMGDVVAQSFLGIGDVHRYGDGERVAIGRPIDNTTLILEDTDENGVGRMTFSGPSVASGDAFRTGDRAKLVEDGLLVYLGREDSQVKIAGNRFELGEVEAILQNDCACKEPVVLFDREKIVAFLDENEGGARLDRKILERRLPSYAIPRILRIGKFPRLPSSGKVDRRRLLEIHALMEALAEAGVDVGSVDGALGIDFFAAGGTSMNAIAAISNLRRRSFDVSIDSLLGASKLGDVVGAMVPRDAEPSSAADPIRIAGGKLSIVASNQLDMSAAIALLATSFIDEALLTFVHRGEPERKRVCQRDIEQLFRALWPLLSRNGISFGVERDGQLVGLCLNLDDAEPPSQMPDLQLMPEIMSFLDEAERPLLDRLRAAGIKRILHGFAVAIDRSRLPEPGDRVAMMLRLERELLRVAIEEGYQVVVATNTNQLTQDIAEHVLGYHVESTIEQLAAWGDAATGHSRPFAIAPPSHSVKVCAKYLLGTHRPA